MGVKSLAHNANVHDVLSVTWTKKAVSLSPTMWGVVTMRIHAAIILLREITTKRILMLCVTN